MMPLYGEEDTPVSGAGGGLVASPQILTVQNADTTYGMDLSVGNNYGLGASFLNAANGGLPAIQQNAAPSLWWLFLFVIALAVFA